MRRRRAHSRSQRIGLDLLFLQPGSTGGRETHARELVQELIREVDPERFVALVNRETADTGDCLFIDAMPSVCVDVKASARVQWALGECVKLPWVARRESLGLVHGLANFGPPFGAIPSVITVHDLLHRKRPDLVNRSNRIATQLLMERAIRGADAIVCSSDTTKHDVLSLRRVDARVVTTVPCGVASPLDLSGFETTGLLAQLDRDPRNVIFTPSLHLPHKNLNALVASLACIPVQHRPILALTVRREEASDLAQTAARLGVDDSVAMLGWVTEREREWLYRRAALVVLPSLFEGFGLPAAEAMLRSRPVLCSDIAVFREFGREDIDYVDATNAQLLSRGIVDAILQADLPANHVRRKQASQRMERMTWRNAAQATCEVYEQVLSKDVLRP